MHITSIEFYLIYLYDNSINYYMAISMTNFVACLLVYKIHITYINIYIKKPLLSSCSSITIHSFKGFKNITFYYEEIDFMESVSY
jgi:hypothetical protein